MKTKTSTKNKKQTIIVQDLKAGKNPKGGACAQGKHIGKAILDLAAPTKSNIFDRWGNR